jgi:hypothetical protein
MVDVDVHAAGLSLGPRDAPIVSERTARADMRRQIAVLEAQLGDVAISAFPHAGPGPAQPAPLCGPRVLTLGELERLRDALADGLAVARAALRERREEEERNRALLERMLLEPGRYKFARVANRDLGESGCGVWQVRPRLGVIGMLMGWWQVKLSSGCPLAA